MNVSELRDRFSARFQRTCAVVARAPGRVNLIGEHTDYNDGFVLPIATEQETWVAVAPRKDHAVRAYSTEFDDQRTWPIDGWLADDFPHWTAYVAGVAALLRQRDARLNGFDLLIRSDVPPGGGLSSSAALENAAALALSEMAGISLQPNELIDLSRRAEHDFAGVPCGLMDQSVSLLAEPGCAFLLDCRSREFQHIPCDLGEHVFVVIDSGVRHKLATSEYARRQQECRQAVEYFRRRDTQVRALRDVSLDAVRAHIEQMDPLPARRARHVVSENERTLAAAAALRAADLTQFGRLMIESHRSLRDDYQVSSQELDQLVEIITAVDGVLGARMTGGGFGGCVVALTREASVGRIEQAVRADYDSPPGKAARLHRTHPSRGASVEVSEAT
ncbi:MAG: galactokinase [Planctomycetes bacterium]|nr:galactokinase [Planctomycetota bacterium]